MSVKQLFTTTPYRYITYSVIFLIVGSAAVVLILNQTSSLQGNSPTTEDLSVSTDGLEATEGPDLEPITANSSGTDPENDQEEQTTPTSEPPATQTEVPEAPTTPPQVTDPPESDPPPSAGITHGQEINAANTGINAAGISIGDLTPNSGGTYSANGTVLENMYFTDTVTLDGSNQTIRNSIIEIPEGQNARLLRLMGNGGVIENVVVRALGAGNYTCIDITGSNYTLRRVDSSNCENTVVTYGTNVTIEESYLHDPATPDPGGHHDVLEIYGGTNVVLRKSRLTMWAQETAAVNIAPWYGSETVDGVRIEDNFIDGGNFHFIFDNQAGGIFNVQVYRNRLGGATNFGGYVAYRGPDGNDPTHVRTTSAQSSNPESILWPNTGGNVNRWSVEQSLTPDLTGQIVE
jgi:hypothetical protein